MKTMSRWMVVGALLLGQLASAEIEVIMPVQAQIKPANTGAIAVPPPKGESARKAPPSDVLTFRNEIGRAHV